MGTFSQVSAGLFCIGVQIVSWGFYVVNAVKSKSNRSDSQCSKTELLFVPLAHQDIRSSLSPRGDWPSFRRKQRHHLHQLFVFLPQFGDFARCRFPLRVPSQPLFACLQEILAPAVIQSRGNPFASAQFRDALFASQSFQFDPHFLFRRVPLPRLPTNLPYPILC